MTIAESIKSRRYILLVFLSVAVTILLFTKTIPGTAGPDTSRLALAESLVERNSIFIDQSYFSYTGDQVRIDGKRFSDKAPMLSFYLAIPYAVLNKAFGLSFSTNPQLCHYILTLFSSGLSTLALMYYLFLLIRREGVDENIAAILLLSLYYSTILMPYSFTINNHTPAIAMILASWHYSKSDKPLLSGLIASLAVSVDLASVFILLPLVLSDKNRIKIIAGGIPLALLFIAWNFKVAGSIIPHSMRPELFQFEGSITAPAVQGSGIMHETITAYLTYLFHYLIGNRGLLAYSPACIIGIYGMLKHPEKFIYPMISILLFIAGTTLSSNNYAGWCWGVRWHILAVPIFFYAIHPLLQKPSLLFKTAFAATTIIGFSLSVIGSKDPWLMTLNDDSSITARFSREKQYIEQDYLFGIAFAEKGKLIYAMSKFEDALDRDPDFKPAQMAKKAVRTEILKNEI